MQRESLTCSSTTRAIPHAPWSASAHAGVTLLVQVAEKKEKLEKSVCLLEEAASTYWGCRRGRTRGDTPCPVGMGGHVVVPWRCLHAPCCRVHDMSSVPFCSLNNMGQEQEAKESTKNCSVLRQGGTEYGVVSMEMTWLQRPVARERAVPSHMSFPPPALPPSWTWQRKKKPFMPRPTTQIPATLPLFFFFTPLCFKKKNPQLV